MTTQELRARAAVTQQLCRRFPDVPRDLVRELVDEAFEGYAGARIRDFVELLVERQVANRLRAGAGDVPASGAAAEAPISA